MDHTDERFLGFHAANPDLYEEIVRIARKAKDNGRTRLSMRGLFEFIRFRRTIEIKGDGEYELNNTYTSAYSRLVREQEPELANLFEIRDSVRSVRSSERRATLENQGGEADYFDLMNSIAS